ncbi:MAG: secretin and TonB N-terminal domain-containing protein [Candidatus Omnitrophica bacterium]|nr:secretin and TonB N-terminal domain-containing protein [Candidatus Omnitrophota bacterium]MBU4488008.1 secretin and TonB N-terminal domain-containing protein [Candidatus Omnitrophota bacterium]MCG2704750.1 secretin and TonB N-terminal domain-containing protein [Candidatus Omnitrophota bacterium]
MKKKIIFLGVLLTFFIAINGNLHSRAEDVTGGSFLTEAPAIDAENGADAAQTGPPADTQAEPEIEASKEKSEYDMMSERIAPGNITVDFKEADIRTVLRILSEKSGVNIVASKDVAGTITIRLNNVYWEKALDIICKNYGYAFERDGNIIRVTTVENLKQEELTTEVFSLNYANAEDVAVAVAEMLSSRGKDKVKFDERTNVLIVTDIPTNLYKIRQVVDKLDKRTPQVLIEAKIIETTLVDTENLGIDWTVKLSAYGAKRPITFPFTVSGTLSYLGIPKDMWNTFMPRVEGTTDTTTTGSGGVTVTDTDSFFPIELGQFRQWSDSPFPLTEADQFTFGTLDFSQFSLVLEYLKSRRDTNVLSNPRIATLNNQEANILVGTILAIPKFERNPDTGTMEVTGYTEKDLGIKLNVIPHINASGDIVVDLRPEISDLLGFDTLDASRGLVAPRYSTREATTQIMVRDGETIMIGGLIRENTVNYKKKVPWLGDIPVLGRALFTKTEETIQKTELIIFMTVHLINSDTSDFGLVPSSALVPMPAKK